MSERRTGARGRGRVPEHDEHVGDVVHALVVHEVELFVRGRHEEEAVWRR